MALVPGELDVEKGTNTSKCPVVELGCNHYGSIIHVDRYLCNDGFKLNFDFSLTGFSLSKDQIRKLSSMMSKLASSILHDYEADHCQDDLYEHGDLFGALLKD